MMKLLFITGREISYQRNEVLLRAFRRFSSVDVIGSFHRPKSLLVNSIKLSIQGIKYLMAAKYDLLFTGFYGHLIFLPLRMTSRCPILFDAFVSTYDTLIEDRKVGTRSSVLARAASWLDKTTCDLASLVLLDTQKHIDYFTKQFAIDSKKFRSLPVGCNEEIFFPQAKSLPSERFNIIYYTSYLPLHGVGVVLQAAKQLDPNRFTFRLIGSGQTYGESVELARRMNLKNVEFIPPMSIQNIANEIANSDLCLGGHFGSSEKAGRVIPSKIYQILAMSKPLIAAATPANLELLSHNETAYLCNSNDPEGLAAAIEFLESDNRHREWLAQQGYLLFKKTCSEAIITKQLEAIVNMLIREP